MILAVASSRRRGRGGYTLLEVIVASAIALVVMIALYAFMQVSLRQASEGRDIVERSALSRAIIGRLTSDLTPSLTPPAATSTKTTSSSTGSASSSTASSSSSSGTSSSTDSTTTDSTSTTSTTIALQAGVIGYENYVTIYSTRLPDVTSTSLSASADTSKPTPTDLRRIVYWIAESGGLCRQELPWVTGDSVRTVDGPVMEDGKSEKDYVIASEVVALSFEYYDPSATTDDGGWLTEWDGRTVGADQKTPQGPPSAIRITFKVQYKNQRGEEVAKQYRHTIAIPTASGPSSTTQESTPAASDTTTTGQ